MIQVVAALLASEGRLLIAQRPEGKQWAGKWEFPGGKLEPGESPEQALERELMEEVGVRVRVGRLYEAVKSADSGVHLMFYRCCLEAGEPFAREGQHLCWALPEELCTYDFIPADAGLIERIAREGLGEV